MLGFEGEAIGELAPGVVRVIAPNPSAMTGRGTNSYLVGTTDLVAIDPGPVDQDHTEALVDVAAGRLRYVLATHSHRDHLPGAAMLCELTGATMLSFRSVDAGAADGHVGDGDLIRVPGVSLRALFTPGHSSDHLCYVVEERSDPRMPRYLFSGDHVLGGSTVAITPPDGDMSDYLISLEKLIGIAPSVEAIAPGHGGVLDDPLASLVEYREHRLQREAQVVTTLGILGSADTARLVAELYVGLSPRLAQAARATIWAHLLKLRAEGVVDSPSPSDPSATWSLT